MWPSSLTSMFLPFFVSLSYSVQIFTLSPTLFNIFLFFNPHRLQSFFPIYPQIENLQKKKSMAETASALCFSASIPISSPYSRASTSSFTPRRFNSQFHRSRLPYLKFTIRASGSSNFIGDGYYPWENHESAADSSIQWVSEEKITLFTSDGLIRIGGNLVPRRVSSADKKQGNSKMTQRSQRFQESKYMDPNQSLCLGALFDIAATNGLNTGRRLCIYGFCRSIEMLCDVVEDTVLEHGGEVVAAEKASRGGLHEKLTMTVAVPLLWGVPPASETLHLAVMSGGGIVDKVYWQWDFL